MSEPLEIRTRETGDGVTVVALSGVLDKHSKPALERAIQELAEAGRNKLVVSCEGLRHMSTDGMGVFLSHLIKIKKAGGDIKFCCMREEVRAVISVLGLGKLLVVRDSEAAALEDFASLAATRHKPKEAEKLRIEVQEEDGVAVISLHGFVDRHTIEQLDQTLAARLEAGRARLVIDCAELTYISSNGMGVFISYVSKARTQGGDIRLCNMRDIARTVITMLGLHRLFRVFESRAEAVASYRDG